MNQLVLVLFLSLFSAVLLQVQSNDLSNESSNDLTSNNQTNYCPGMDVWCPSHQSCCRSDGSQHKYMCCSYNEGVCCDKRFSHCCNRGQYCTQWGCTSINPTEGDKRPETGGALLSAPLLQQDDNKKTVCPDKTTCDSTCCKQVDRGYGCCPVPSGVCCKDQDFCCPEGFQCTDSSCISTVDELPLISMLVKDKKVEKGSDQLLLEKRIEQFEQVSNSLAFNISTHCGDGSRCHDHQTCCATGTGAFNCCPFPSGVCCPNGKTCCPSGFICATDVCTYDTTSVSLSKSQQNTLDLINDVADSFLITNNVDDNDYNQYPIYCGNGALCTGNKCCLIEGTDIFNCCPYQQGICCTNYCCPEGYKCGNDTDPEGIPCILMTADLIYNLPQDIICSDDVSTCLDGQTCCPKPDKTFNCAPFPNATCCSDGIHACPENFICEDDTNLCKPKPTPEVTHFLAMNKKFEEMKKKKIHLPPEKIDHEKIICDEEMECTDNQTCCLLPDTTFGCCPFPDAICCADRQHCCSQGYHCHRSDHWKCIKDSFSITSKTYKDATPIIKTPKDATNIIKPLTSLMSPRPLTHQCNDKYRCSNTATCCIRPDGSYGCCPYEDALCCPDRLHCCQSGSHCDMVQKMCVNDTISVPFGIKFSAILKVPQPALSDEICSDTVSCPTHTTCCILTDDSYGCCPYPDAVCCSDKVSCCPNGYTCNVTTSACELPHDLKLEKRPEENVETPVSMTSSLSAIKDVERPYTVLNSMLKPKLGLVPCNDKYSCPDDNTCCNIEKGEFGCCGYSKATCCIDKVHCCPQGFKCDLADASCVQGKEVMPLLAKDTPITKGESLDYPSGSIEPLPKVTAQQLCPDNISSCDMLDTCCVVPGGDYGCCPIKNATCCTDSWHCCPSDMYCLSIYGVCYIFDEHGEKVYKDWLSLETISENHIKSRRNNLP